MGRLPLFTDEGQMDQDVCQNVHGAEMVSMNVHELSFDLICRSYGTSKKSTKWRNCGAQLALWTKFIGRIKNRGQFSKPPVTSEKFRMNFFKIMTSQYV